MHLSNCDLALLDTYIQRNIEIQDICGLQNYSICYMCLKYGLCLVGAFLYEHVTEIKQANRHYAVLKNDSEASIIAQKKV